MRFRLGPPPEDPSLDSDKQWSMLRLPHAMLLQLLALPLGVLLAYAMLLAWSWTPLGDLRFSIQSPLDVVGIMIAVAGLLLVHELLHGLAHPGGGRSPLTLIGLHVTAVLPYAAYLGEMSRTRTLLVLSAPFLVLSVLPWLICLVGQRDGGWLAILSILNAFGCGGDLLIAAWVLWKVPPAARLRDSGWSMWWREP